MPYTLAISGQWFDTATRNPVFGLVLCLVMFYFYGRYPEKKAAHTLMRILVTALSVIWSRMLGIDFGAGVVLITAAMWIFRDKPMYRNFSGAIAAAVSSAFSPFFLAAPMGLLLTHFYNEEKSTNSRAAKYLAYPAVLVGMVYALLPFMILSVYSSVEKMDWSLVEAARDLGASKARAFWTVTAKLTLPGVLSGVILTFIPSMGLFFIADVLGGGKFMLVGNLIRDQLFSARDWPFAAALAVILTLLTTLFLWLYRKITHVRDLEGIL